MHFNAEQLYILCKHKHTHISWFTRESLQCTYLDSNFWIFFLFYYPIKINVNLSQQSTTIRKSVHNFRTHVYGVKVYWVNWIPREHSHNLNTILEFNRTDFVVPLLRHCLTEWKWIERNFPQIEVFQRSLFTVGCTNIPKKRVSHVAGFCFQSFTRISGVKKLMANNL